MAWPMILFTAISAGSQVAGGISASNQAKKNAQTSLTYSQYNSKLSSIYGEYDKNVIVSSGVASASAVTKVADFNATVKEMVGEHNARLNEREAAYILDTAEIDVARVQDEVKRTMSTNRAVYASAGVQVNNEGDSPFVKNVDVATQGAIDVAIIRHGAKIEANRFLDQAAMSRWDGTVGGMLTRYGAQAQANTILTDAFNRGNMAEYQGKVGAKNALWQGQAEYSQYMSQASNSMFSGITGAASSIFGAWANGSFRSATTGATGGSTFAPDKYTVNWGSNPGGVGTSPLTAYA